MKESKHFYLADDYCFFFLVETDDYCLLKFKYNQLPRFIQERAGLIMDIGVLLECLDLVYFSRFRGN